MNREQAFLSFSTHAFLHKLYAKMKANDRAIAFQFLQENAALSRADFEYKLNRFFLDKPEKPKNWAIISELLCNANSKGEI